MHSYQIQKATTNVSVELRIIDSTDGTPETGVVWNTTGIDLQYRRDGAASTAITEATLAALTTAHTDGGFLHIGNGVYRFDLPDAACATGVDKVIVHGTVTGMVVIGCVLQLVDYDPFDAVRMGMTALPNAAADAAGGLPISDAGALDLDALNTAAVRLTAARSQVLDDWINAGRLDIILDIIAADVVNLDGAAMRGTDNASLASVCTETRLSELDAATGGKMANQVDIIQTDTTTDIPATITTAQNDLDILTGADGVILDTSQPNYEPATAGAWMGLSDSGIDRIWDELVTGHTTNNTYGKILKGIAEGWIADEGSVNDASATTTSFISDLTNATTSFFSDATVVFITGALKGQSRIVTDYNGSTKAFTFDEAFTSAPADTDQFIVLAQHTHPLSEITAEIDANSTQLAAIVADTTTDIPALIAALNDLSAAQVNAECDTALADYDGPTNAEMEARTPTAAQLAYIVANAATGLPATFSGTGTTTTGTMALVDGATPSAVDDQYNGRLLVFNAGTLNQVVTDITDYNGATKVATVTAVPIAITSAHTARLI